MDGRTYLAVPYADRDAAKALGARWDTTEKAWFAPEGTALNAGLDRWLPTPGAGDRSSDYVPDHVAKAEFGKMLRAAGAILDGDPVMDGERHRVRMKGDKQYEKSGKYKGYLDKTPAGSLQDYRTGDVHLWSYQGEREAISAEERAVRDALHAADREARERAELAKYENAAKIAARIYELSDRATPANAYCREKGIRNPGGEGLRMVPAAFSDDLTAMGVVVAPNTAAAKAIRKQKPDATIFIKGDLLVPAYDMAGKIWTVQSINSSFKSFMRGSRKQGLHTMAGTKGPFHESVLATSVVLPIVISEGRSTGDALARALGHPVVVAFDAGNIRAVAKALHEAYPYRDIVIAGDNDHFRAHEMLDNGRLRGNRGVEAASAVVAELRKGIGTAVTVPSVVAVIPEFPAENRGSDWNDVAKERGVPKMRQQFIAALTKAVQEAGAVEIETPAAAIGDRQSPRAPRVMTGKTPDAEPERDPATSLARPANRPAHPTNREISHDR